MKIEKAIKRLEELKDKFGNVEVQLEDFKMDNWNEEVVAVI